jgi:hypothetical protein
MKRNNSFLVTQTLSAFGFALFFIVLSFSVHPPGERVGVPLLIIAGVLIFAGLFGVIYWRAKSTSGK